MLATIIFAVVFVMNGVNGKPSSQENSVPLPCNFNAYDLDGNLAISIEEFMSATEGFTKMDHMTLFGLFDRNGDKFIRVGEFKYVPRSIVKAGILNHCFRRMSQLKFCFGLCWGK